MQYLFKDINQNVPFYVLTNFKKSHIFKSKTNLLNYLLNYL